MPGRVSLSLRRMISINGRSTAGMLRAFALLRSFLRIFVRRAPRQWRGRSARPARYMPRGGCPRAAPRSCGSAAPPPGSAQQVQNRFKVGVALGQGVLFRTCASGAPPAGSATKDSVGVDAGWPALVQNMYYYGDVLHIDAGKRCNLRPRVHSHQKTVGLQRLQSILYVRIRSQNPETPTLRPRVHSQCARR